MERQPQHPEQLPQVEAAELDKLNAQMERKLELAEAETGTAERVESARRQIEHQAEELPTPSEVKTEPKRLNKLDELVNYRHTLSSMRRRLGPASRTFSRVIHQPAVEAASEVIGKTVLRPSVTLGASVTAVLVGGGLYLLARRYGFELRGSEIVLSALAGAILGLIIELVIKAVSRFKH